jgi:transposase-like protein
MKEPKSKYGKRFSEEFQRDAVRMLESGERTAKQLSQELGVSEWSLKRWAKFHGRTDQAKKRAQESALELENAKLRRELETVSRQRDILGIRHLGPRSEQLYEVIGIMEQDATYSRKELCLALGVSRSGRYNHLHKANKGRRQQNERLGARIVEIFRQRRGCYGWRRIQATLRREGTRCGKKRILRLMKRHGLRAMQKRRFRPRTTQSRHEQSPCSVPVQRQHTTRNVTAWWVNLRNSRIAFTSSSSGSCRSFTVFRTPSFTIRPSRSIVLRFGGGRSTPATCCSAVPHISPVRLSY